MPRGGSKPGERRGGRQKGSRNKATRVLLDAVAASGEVPLDYMLRVMRDPEADVDRRDRMALGAAVFVHSRLASVEARVGPLTHDDFWAKIERERASLNGHANGKDA